MGYLTKVQMIARANDTRQFYVICPAPLAEALGLEKGEAIEWEVEDRQTLVLRRSPSVKDHRRRSARAR